MLLALVAVASGCSDRPARLGTLVDLAPLSRTDAGPAPARVSSRGMLDDGTFRRVVEGDVLGDEGAERVVEVGGGAGLDVLDGSGHVVSRIRTSEYLTAFDLVEATRAPKRDVVVYTYPNDSGGGTFAVVTPDGVEQARWREQPPPSHPAVGRWGEAVAVFYLQRDDLVVRSAHGDELARIAVPSGVVFQSLYAATLASGMVVFVASGGGYMPYHMVFAIDPPSALVYQLIAREQAFALERDGDGRGFRVFARSRIWRYRAP
ncbi:MAG: hypothetical protein AB1635_09275 [Acidobacteriota bacterium]